ncbi:MAG: transporter substrate-binding domain-containing protein, partial [Clostridia bacterium]|nr:transporter substrate-binding domain-containing protein [Clostridia bacterium]
MKKIITLVLIAALTMLSCFAFASCGNKDLTDSEYVKKNGKLVVGITDFKPMDYQDADGKWIGFDADMAAKFAEYLGVTVEFQEIEWDNKELELDGKQIDCV